MLGEEEEELIDIKEEIYKDISFTNPATESRQGQIHKIIVSLTLYQ